MKFNRPNVDAASPIGCLASGCPVSNATDAWNVASSCATESFQQPMDGIAMALSSVVCVVRRGWPGVNG